ncbi:hypothetical protein DYB32_001926 [Aphanomyces invadans]|uniref:Homeobox domain-containing protein n=1 Tax=Aphanomyces invadans TaxID=157072 RepID=A0A3R6Z371_9STRA|nr:hypothetical protein DYB32_001926 [Aphanomyces invadans]
MPTGGRHNGGSEGEQSSDEPDKEQGDENEDANDENIAPDETTGGDRKPRRELPPATVKILKDWMLSSEHIKHPYPTDDDKKKLLELTGINMKQLTNWFTNARKRIWKPMIRREHSRQLHSSLESHAASTDATYTYDLLRVPEAPPSQPFLPPRVESTKNDAAKTSPRQKRERPGGSSGNADGSDAQQGKDKRVRRSALLPPHVIKNIRNLIYKSDNDHAAARSEFKSDRVFHVNANLARPFDDGAAPFSHGQFPSPSHLTASMPRYPFPGTSLGAVVAPREGRSHTLDMGSFRRSRMNFQDVLNASTTPIAAPPTRMQWSTGQDCSSSRRETGTFSRPLPSLHTPSSSAGFPCGHL